MPSSNFLLLRRINHRAAYRAAVECRLSQASVLPPPRYWRCIQEYKGCLIPISVHIDSSSQSRVNLREAGLGSLRALPAPCPEDAPTLRLLRPFSCMVQLSPHSHPTPTRLHVKCVTVPVHSSPSAGRASCSLTDLVQQAQAGRARIAHRDSSQTVPIPSVSTGEDHLG